MRIELAWVGEGGDVVRHALELPEAATIDDALAALGEALAGGLRARIDDASLAVAVYGKSRTLQSVLHDGDRVELVGPLAVDPRTARRQRVRQQRSDGADRRWKQRRGTP